MRTKMWSAGLAVCLILSHTGVAADEAGAPAPVRIAAAPFAPTADLADDGERTRFPLPPLERLAAMHAELSDWREGDARIVRELHAPTGERNALLFAVEKDGTALGYVVTAVDGQQVYEFSRRSVPELGNEMSGGVLASGYMYSGPLMHLAYWQGAEGLEVYNLLTGEKVPAGELLNHVPDLGAEDAAKPSGNTAAIERRLPRGERPDSHAVHASGLYGMSLSQQTEGVRPLRAFLAESMRPHTLETPSFIVFDAIPDKLYMTYGITSLLELPNGIAFVGLTDPFQPDLPAVYISSTFDVPAVTLPAGELYTGF